MRYLNDADEIISISNTCHTMPRTKSLGSKSNSSLNRVLDVSSLSNLLAHFCLLFGSSPAKGTFQPKTNYQAFLLFSVGVVKPLVLGNGNEFHDWMKS